MFYIDNDFIFLNKDNPKYIETIKQIAIFCKTNKMYSDLIHCSYCTKRYWLTYYDGYCPHCHKGLK